MKSYSEIIFEWLCGLDEDLLESLAVQYGIPETNAGELHNEIINSEDLEAFCEEHYLI